MNFKALFAVMVTLLVLDFIWLGVMSRGFFRNEIGDLLRDKVSWVPGVLVYVLLTVGIFVFVLNSSFADGVLRTVGLGVLFGVVVYGVYDLTNLALVRGWTVRAALVDVLWGGFIGGVAAYVGSRFV